MVDSGGQVVYELKVEMVCDACSNAVKRILEKCPDLTEVPDINWESQKVFATGKDGLDLVAML